MSRRATTASLRTAFGRGARAALPGLAMVAAAVACALAAERWLGLSEPAVVILLGVLLAAARSTAGPALLAACTGFLAYNVLFIEPRLSLHIGSQAGWVTGAVFLASALLAGRLASRLAAQVGALDQARKRAEARQQLVRTLMQAEDAAAVRAIAERTFAAQLDVQVEWLPPPSAEETSSASPARAEAFRLVLPGPEGPLGGLGLRSREGGEPGLGTGQRALAESFAVDIAQALVRLQLSAAVSEKQVAIETERLRSALLASVSHDLRSPLSGIIGAADTLDSYGSSLSEDDRRALLDTIREEGERLDRYIRNLLDMTRLGHQTLPLERDWIGVDELVGAVVARARRHWPNACIETRLPDAMPPVFVHAALVEQALYNVVENALSFSPAGQPVEIHAEVPQGRALCIDVLDRGPGIPEAERERIFDFFHSVQRGDRRRGGSGLGLTISRGMIGAHGGDVRASARDPGPGSRFSIQLPLPGETA